MVFLVLARYLSPTDFGIVAAAVIVISLSQVVSDSGFSKALVQRSELAVETAVGSVLWANTLIAVGLYGLVFLAADGVASLFGDQRIAAVLRVQGVQLLLVAPAAALRAQFERELLFRPIFFARTITALIPGAVAIPAVVLGAGYWSLTAGALAGSAVQLVVLYAMSTWTFSWVFDREVLRALGSFAGWVTAESMLYWVYTWGDAFVIGSILDAESLGLYRSANTLVITLFAALISPLQPVLFSAFSRLQSDPEKLYAGYRRSAVLVAMVSVPAGVGLFLIGDTAAVVLLPADWVGIGTALGILGFMHGMAWIVGINDDLYRAIGKPRINTFVMLGALAVYLPVYLFAAQLGFNEFLWARLTLSLCAVLLHMVIAGRVIGCGVACAVSQLRWVFLAAGLMALTVAPLERVAPWNSPGSTLAAQVALGAAVYGATIAWLERDIIRDLVARVRALRTDRTQDE